MIPVSEPLIGQSEREYVADCLRSGWVSSEGKYIQEFEEKFAAYVGRRYAIAVNNGTNALILAVKALNLPTGSEVIIPSFTIISCALACIYNNLIPVFVDADRETWTVACSQIEAKIGDNTRAIMPVHIYGHPAHMKEIVRIAQKYHLQVIEDFAEAIGSEYDGKKCGVFGEISCASFFANKVITTGEGGMCLTDDFQLSETLKSLRNLAFIPDKRFVHYQMGFNFRMTNIQAALGVGQMEKIADHVARKIAIAQRYNDRLKPLVDKQLIQLPVEKAWAKNSYWMFGILLSEKSQFSAHEVIQIMKEEGVQTRPFFFPMHLQPVFKECAWFKAESLPVSEMLYRFGFYVPSGLTLTDDQIDIVCKAITKVLL